MGTLDWHCGRINTNTEFRRNQGNNSIFIWKRQLGMALRVTHPETKEYLIGIIMAVVSHVLLFIPAVRRKLVDVKV
jgi:hypothetical protein